MRRSRRGLSEIVGVLTLILGAMLLTSVVLYWGLALQQSSQSNFGQAVYRQNNQAAEDISIDSVVFMKTSTFGQSDTFTAVVYVRNFGSVPVNIAGVHVVNLKPGISPAGVNCEVTQSSAAKHLVVSSLDSASIGLSPTSTTSGYSVSGSAVSLSTKGWCSSVTFAPSGGTFASFPSNWDGTTISIQVSTDQGTSYTANFALPA